VDLGLLSDIYAPQQAIRTFSNMTSPEKYYLKMTLNIFNTAVFRGLPAARVLLAADLSDWLKQIVDHDPELKETYRPVLLSEVAGMTVKHPLYAQMTQTPYQYQESLAVIWRESLTPYLESDEKAYSLSALLFENHKKESLIGALVDQSGLSLEHWLDLFHSVLLTPLCHFLYAHGVAFNAHGQNLILITKNGIPSRLCLKDFADDVNVDESFIPHYKNFPPSCKGILLEQPGEILIHFIYSSLMMCYYRYLVPLLEDWEEQKERNRSSRQRVEALFWNSARKTLESYQEDHPHLQERIKKYSLLEAEMPKVCLNRVRLYTYGYSHDDKRPEPALHGFVKNPLVQFSHTDSSVAFQ
jgi:siderophore synthetase component